MYLKFSTRFLGFLSRWWRIRARNSEIQDGRSNTADKNGKSHLVGMKFSTRGFLRSLITNPSLKFKILKWRIQYDGPKFKFYSIEIKISTRRFLGSLIANQSSTLRNSKCQIKYGEPKWKNLLDYYLYLWILMDLNYQI